MMALLSDITFLDVSLTLITLGVLERLALRYLPDSVVGPDGWLLVTE